MDGCCGDCRALGAGFGGIVGFWWGIGQLEVFMGLGCNRRRVFAKFVGSLLWVEFVVLYGHIVTD